MKKLENIDRELFLNEEIAVVGSSGYLRDKQYGSKIDEFEHIVRFNRAPVEGYEKYCGTNTYLRICNSHVFGNVDITKNDGGYSDQPPNFVRNLRNTKILYICPDISHWMRKEQNVDSSVECYLFNYHNVNKIKNQLGFFFDKNPTVGGCFIFACILSGIKPHMFGFDVEPKEIRTHYWETRPPQADNKSHNISAEQECLLELEKQGKLIIHR